MLLSCGGGQRGLPGRLAYDASVSSRSAAGVDVGGTFTDVVTVGAGGLPRAVKVPTTPSDQSRGLADGLAAAGAAAAPHVAHGTTTATNAVLERTLARTVLVTTRGFRDVLTIGRQDRPSLYDLGVVRPAPVVAPPYVVTVAERIAADGSVVVALTGAEIDRVVRAVADLDPEAIAVSLLFSWANAAHEQALATALERRLDVPVTRSSVLLPELREYERASTCVLDAAVTPLMRGYLTRITARVPAADVTVMTSGGGVAAVAEVADAPILTLLSGPAAGVVAAGAVARSAGFGDALAFDMGGTSTDVCLIRDGRPEVFSEASIGGLPFRTPAVAVHTVGAGGGSIAYLDRGGALQVGPRSAGARPGPAAYGRGGREPTVTDAHVVLGHLASGQALGAGADVRLDHAAAAAALRTLAGFDDEAAAAEGVLSVVRASMARALRRVSTERGVDPSTLALVAYGGAGPLHAAALAAELGCAATVVPPAPGVLSALGLLLAPPRAEVSRSVLARCERDAPAPDLDEVWADLERAARARLPGATLTRVADCRYAGQSHELRLTVGGSHDAAATLDAAHDRAYGYAMPAEPVDIVTVRVVAEATPALTAPPDRWDLGPARPRRRREVVLDGARAAVTVLDRAELAAGDEISGPALVEQPDSTVLLGPADCARTDDAGNLVIGRRP